MTRGVSLRARLIAAYALALLVSAAAAARPGGTVAVVHSSLALAILAPVIALVVIVAIAGAGFTGYGLLSGLRSSHLLIVSALLLFLVVPVVVIAHYSRQSHPRPIVCWPPQSLRCTRGHESSGSTRLGSAPAASGTGTRLAVAAASVGGIVIVSLACLLLLRRRRPPSDQLVALDNPLDAAVDESLDDLRSESDVRRAVIGCYARMERALLRAGYGRHPAEAPLEYLRRALSSIAPIPGARLTELFEVAAFSVEPMGDREKVRAIEALETLRRVAA